MNSVPIRFFGVLMSFIVMVVTVLLAVQGIADLAENSLHYLLNLLIVLVTALLFLILTRRCYVRMRAIVLGIFPLVTFILMNALYSLLHGAMTGEVPPEHDYSFLFLVPVVTFALLAWGVYFDRLKNRLLKP